MIKVILTIDWIYYFLKSIVNLNLDLCIIIICYKFSESNNTKHKSSFKRYPLGITQSECKSDTFITSVKYVLRSRKNGPKRSV